MAKVKYSDRLIGLKCTGCGQRNYYTRKNKRQIEQKFEFSKYCPRERQHIKHKEVKLTGK